MSPKVRGIVRVAVVATLALFCFTTLVVPAMSALWYSAGTFGMIAADSRIVRVDEGLPAARAGLRAGDVIEGPLTPTDRVYLYMQYPRPGQKLTLHVLRDGTSRTVTLVADAAPFSTVDALLIFLRATVYLAVLAFGASLILLHPSLMTWGFGLFCMMSLGPTVSAQTQLSYLPPSMWIPITAVQTILYNLGAVAFLVFAFRFPGDVDRTRWRTAVMRVVPLVAIACVVLDSVNLVQWGRGTYQNWIDYVEYALYVAIFVISGIALFETYLMSSGSEKPRLRWALLGTGIGYALFVINNVGYELSLSGGLHAYQTLMSISGILEIVIPVTVGYAILRHRVIDVAVVIDRALVYGVTTAIVVSIISLAHWFIGKRLESAHLQLVAEVCAALLVGWGLNRIHGWVEEFSKRFLFRRWYASVKRLDQLGDALSYAESQETVDELVVAEPLEALELASAAAFHIGEDRIYRIGTNVGWNGAVTSIEAENPMVLRMRSEGNPIRTHEIRTIPGLPGGNAAPVLAVPLRSRHHVFAFVLYGAHTNGADLSADDINALTKLAASATLAYETIAAQQNAREIERLRAQVDALSGLVASRVHGQTAPEGIWQHTET